MHALDAVRAAVHVVIALQSAINPKRCACAGKHVWSSAMSDHHGQVCPSYGSWHGVCCVSAGLMSTWPMLPTPQEQSSASAQSELLDSTAPAAEHDVATPRTEAGELRSLGAQQYPSSAGPCPCIADHPRPRCISGDSCYACLCTRSSKEL